MWPEGVGINVCDSEVGPFPSSSGVVAGDLNVRSRRRLGDGARVRRPRPVLAPVGLRPERRRRRARAVGAAHRARRKHRADNLTCSTQFASPRPLQNGEMHVGLGEGEAARRVRISFRATHSGPPEQRYYTLRTLVLGARCRCHGHAERCTLSAQGSVCECQHGTCGEHCEYCCLGEKWAPGVPCGGHEVSKEVAVKSDDCSCAERGACAVDDTGAILCVNCTENRAGPLCDRCLSGFYSTRPDGLCKPCTCHPAGSDGKVDLLNKRSGTCKWDKVRSEVSCNCLVGFAGNLCDSCADAAGVFPDCTTPATTTYCKCDSRGIINSDDACADVCKCKAHVTGETCNTCKPGYYGLSGDLGAGCRRCYCSGVTDLCAADPDLGETVELPLGESSWLVVDAELNETHAPSIDDAGHLSLIIYEASL
ncbi:Laminin subunit alpha-2 [Eumeta japonica]|uniref:Laminin subunit alpha-2 n=1 Tax=Eumeta variegata TaxID=151549 RepID=A0A4C1ZZX7_EUMVA|nr:Laminin subunit alpha-2 [Eumeta japonica]